MRYSCAVELLLGPVLSAKSVLLLISLYLDGVGVHVELVLDHHVLDYPVVVQLDHLHLSMIMILFGQRLLCTIVSV